ncbi:MAG: hypothetical protein A3K19_16145 [Lentisphaerae bacterium RIFOXYB12_FULL_65_16]|nr:MAG: hypothetical protein A3K18_05070 [Lentisphaerae bacterium RIFOXYA12_64_32]OGV92563.1 MAG: hypothetical protein A3K19_16145 [Lentisphaerae bacterium RIFOXYB12_FULL_65_16]
MRCCRKFSWKDTNVRVRCDLFDVVTRALVAQRTQLEAYIQQHPEFRTALEPIVLLTDAPPIARAMARAGELTGVGPMAAVAGAMAQFAAESARRRGAVEAIVENGGDIFLDAPEAVVVGIFSGRGKLGARLAFRVEPERMPLAVCSSSSRMGHSLSFGCCDLATVVATDAALADAAATQACNLVRTQEDIEPVLARIRAIPGISGLLLVKDERVGLMGDLPPLVRNADPDVGAKVTRDAAGQVP